MSYKKMLLSALIAGISLMMAMFAQAAIFLNASITVQDNTGTCATSTFTASFRYQAVNNDQGSGFDRVGIIVFDGNDVPISTTWTGWSASAMSPIITWTVDFGDSVMNAITARPLTMVVYDITAAAGAGSNTQPVYNAIVGQDAPVLATVIYDPADDIPDCANLPYMGVVAPNDPNIPARLFDDGRINPDAAASYVIYANENLLILYTPQGALIGTVEVGTCPAENTLIFEAGGVRLYHLSSCELQAMGAALDSTKTYIVRFTLGGDYVSFEA